MWGHSRQALDQKIGTINRCNAILERQVKVLSRCYLAPCSDVQENELTYWESRYELTVRGMDDETINRLLGPEPKT